MVGEGAERAVQLPLEPIELIDLPMPRKLKPAPPQSWRRYEPSMEMPGIATSDMTIATSDMSRSGALDRAAAKACSGEVKYVAE
jgi:hypothetical protein